MMTDLLSKADLPNVTFHSLRHTSTTIKLLITSGDIKRVQGDTGHADPKMVTHTYSMIVDRNRKKTAKKMDKEFFASGEDDDGTKDDSKMLKDELEKVFAANPDLLVNMLAANPDLFKQISVAVEKQKL